MKKYVLAVLVVLLSFLLDKPFAIFITNNRVFLLDKFISAFIMVTTPIIFVLITIIMLKKLKLILPLWASFFTTLLLVTLIKSISSRLRPFVALNLARMPNIDYAFIGWNTSFPSWHMAAVSLALPFINKLPRKYQVSWIIFAILIAVSRLYTGFHYLSDVLAGALIGYFTSRLFLYLEENHKLTRKLVNSLKLHKSS